MHLTSRNINGTVGVWLARILWALLAFTASPAFAASLAERSRPVQVVGSVGLWAGWAAGLLAVLIPSTLSLTGIRMLAPVAPLGVLAAGIAGGPTATELALAAATSLIAATVVFAGDLGRQFAQGSAYGDEARFPLRPPGALIAGPLQLLWLVAAAPLTAGPLILAAGGWVIGTALTAFGVWFTWLLAGRFHRLAQRWLVFVPAGVVVHDHVLLSETFMLRREQVSGCGLAPNGTTAADFSGGAPGLAVEFHLGGEPATVVMAASRLEPQGRALHVRSFFLSPSRPGSVLAEARKRSLPALGTPTGSTP